MSAAPTDALPTAIAAFGTGIVVVLILSSVPLYYQGMRKGSLAAVSTAPLVGQWLNFFAWTVYGIAQNDMNIIRVNVIGVGFAVLYAACQVAYNAGAARAAVARLLAAAALLSGALEAGLFFGLAPGAARTSALGICGVVYNVVMFAGPIVALRTALRDGDASALPALLIVVSNVASVTWGTYGYLVGNYYVFVPNVAGTLINLLQLAGVVYLAATGAKKRAADDDGGSYAAVEGAAADGLLN